MGNIKKCNFCERMRVSESEREARDVPPSCLGLGVCVGVVEGGLPPAPVMNGKPHRARERES